MTNLVTHKAEGNTLTIERTFDAPIDLVFKAFSTEEGLTQWWSPEGFTIPKSNFDFREGGSWHYCMLGSPDAGEWAGVEAWGLAMYKEITPPKRIVYNDAFSDETGKVNADLPAAEITYDFVDEGQKTVVKTTAVYPNEEALKVVIDMGMIDGMTSAMTKLDSWLENQQQNK